MRDLAYQKIPRMYANWALVWFVQCINKSVSNIGSDVNPPAEDDHAGAFACFNNTFHCIGCDPISASFDDVELPTQ